MALCGCLAVRGLVLAAAAPAQQIEISSTLNPVGSGARATGMGGAFIGVADDATAASWNPGGLIQLEKPEVSLAYTSFRRRQEYGSAIHPESAGTNEMASDGINYASAAYPFALLRRNMIVSLNYQRLYEMEKSVEGLSYRLQSGNVSSNRSVSFAQTGYLHAVSPAVAIQVATGLSLGAALNVWNGNLAPNGWESTQRGVILTVITRPSYDLHVAEKITESKNVAFQGLNAHAGILWSISGKVTVGAVYKSAFDADLAQDSSLTYDRSTTRTDTGITTIDPTSRVSDHKSLTMRMPASYGVGVAYRHSDELTVAFDIYRTEWSRFTIRTSEGLETNPLDSRPIGEGRLADTTQLRLGAEHLFIGSKHVFPLRVGLFYDPEPARNNPDDYYGCSLGTGYYRGRLALDVSYQFRSGNNVTGDVPWIEGSSVDLRQHTIMTSVVFYF